MSDLIDSVGYYDANLPRFSLSRALVLPNYWSKSLEEVRFFCSTQTRVQVHLDRISSIDSYLLVLSLIFNLVLLQATSRRTARSDM